MTQANNLTNRVQRLEVDNIDLKSAVSALIETVNLHQRNFEVIVTEIRDIRTDIRGLQTEIRDIRTDIRGLQTENRRLLNHLLGEEDSDID